MQQLLKKVFVLIDKIVAKNGRAIGRVLQSVHGRWLMADAHYFISV
jgi:hypothetical protein